MAAVPTVKGFTPIPLHLQQHNSLNRQIVRELKPDLALMLEYPSHADAKDGQAALLMAAQRELGQGRVQTVVQDRTLYLWLRAGEPALLDYLSQHTEEAAHV